MIAREVDSDFPDPHAQPDQGKDPVAVIDNPDIHVDEAGHPVDLGDPDPDDHIESHADPGGAESQLNGRAVVHEGEGQLDEDEDNPDIHVDGAGHPVHLDEPDEGDPIESDESQVDVPAVVHVGEGQLDGYPEADVNGNQIDSPGADLDDPERDVNPVVDKKEKLDQPLGDGDPPGEPLQTQAVAPGIQVIKEPVDNRYDSAVNDGNPEASEVRNQIVPPGPGVDLVNHVDVNPGITIAPLDVVQPLATKKGEEFYADNHPEALSTVDSKKGFYVDDQDQDSPDYTDDENQILPGEQAEGGPVDDGHLNPDVAEKDEYMDEKDSGDDKEYPDKVYVNMKKGPGMIDGGVDDADKDYKDDANVDKNADSDANADQDYGDKADNDAGDNDMNADKDAYGQGYGDKADNDAGDNGADAFEDAYGQDYGDGKDVYGDAKDGGKDYERIMDLGDKDDEQIDECESCRGMSGRWELTRWWWLGNGALTSRNQDITMKLFLFRVVISYFISTSVSYRMTMVYWFMIFAVLSHVACIFYTFRSLIQVLQQVHDNMINRFYCFAFDVLFFE